MGLMFAFTISFLQAQSISAPTFELRKNSTESESECYNNLVLSRWITQGTCASLTYCLYVSLSTGHCSIFSVFRRQHQSEKMTRSTELGTLAFFAKYHRMSNGVSRGIIKDASQKFMHIADRIKKWSKTSLLVSVC